MQNKSKILISLFVGIWIFLPLYIILHEAGHSLVAIFCSAKITKFSILGAYVETEGGVYNTYTSSLMNIAGMLFPVFISFLYIIVYRKDCDNIFYRILSFFFCVIPVFSILAWIIVPILYIMGNAPTYDDVTKFLDNSGIHPLWLVLSSLFLQFVMIIFAGHKNVIKNYWYTMKLLRVKSDTNET